MKACNFIKKKLQHRFFPVKFAKFLKTPILKTICEQLLLTYQSGGNVHTTECIPEENKYQYETLSAIWYHFYNFTTHAFLQTMCVFHVF